MTRYLLVTIMLSTIFLTACAIKPEEMAVVDPAAIATKSTTMIPGHAHLMAPLDGMPEMVRTADARTQEAYRFATANPDAAREAPCYCGCVGLGHTSSYDCYVTAATTDGVLEYDMHAANCTVCVDITHDQMRLMDNGDSPDAIRAFLVQNYSQYGPPTE